MERPIDTYRWGACRFDFGLMFLLKVCSYELQVQAMPHTDGWGNISKTVTRDPVTGRFRKNPPPIQFLRSIIGAQALDELNRMLEEEAVAS